MEQEQKFTEQKYKQLLQDARSADPDYRFMMANEFTEAIERDQILNPDQKNEIIRIIQAQLQDTEGEVQQNALRCIGRLVKKLTKEQIQNLSKDVMELLITVVDNTKISNQDMFSSCMKQIIKEIPDSEIDALANIVPIVAGTIKSKYEILSANNTTDQRKKVIKQNLEAILEITEELFKRNMGTQSQNKKELADNIVTILTNNFDQILQKKASQCLGEVIISLNVTPSSVEEILDKLFKIIDIKNKQKYIVQVRSFSKVINRITQRLSQSKLLQYFQNFKEQIDKQYQEGRNIQDQKVDFDDEKVNELNQVLEKLCEIVASLVQGNPNAMRPHIDTVLDVATKLLQYHPGIQLDLDQNTQNDMEDEDEDEDDDDDYFDDSENTWKVRKEAIKLVRNLIRHYPDLIKKFYEQIINQKGIFFIERIRERNPGVREEIIRCIQSIIKVITVEEQRPDKLYDPSIEDDDFLSANMSAPIRRINSAIEIDLQSFIQRLLDQSSTILLDRKTQNSNKIEIIKFLKDVCNHVHRKIIENPTLWVKTYKIISTQLGASSNNDLKYETLCILKSLVKSKDQIRIDHIVDNITPIIDFCIKSMGDSFFKISSESMKALAHFLRLLQINFQTKLSSFAAKFTTIIQKIEEYFKKQDIDVVVKQALFQLSSSILENIIEILNKDQINLILNYVNNKVVSENKAQTLIKIVLRLPLVKFQKTIKLDASSAKILGEIQSKLVSTYLAKQDRTIKQVVLFTIKKISQILSQNPSFFEQDKSEQFINASLELLNDNDIYLAGITIDIYILLLGSLKSQPLIDQIFQRGIQLCKSNNLQSQVIKEAQSLFDLLTLIAKKKNTSEVIKLIESEVNEQCVHSFSIVISQLIQSLSANDQTSIIKTFSQRAFNKSDKFHIRQLALYVICNFGKDNDLSGNSDIVKGVTNLIQSQDESRDQIKIHAAKCYGGIASFNIEKFIGAIQNQISSNKESYLTLYTLKEALQYTKTTSNEILNITEFLFKESKKNDESLNNIVSECIGIIFKIDYNSKVSSSIANHLNSSDDNTRLVTAQSFRYFCNKGTPAEKVKSAVDALIKKERLEDSVPSVRTAVLKSVSMIVHNVPTSIQNHITKDFYNSIKVSLKIDKALIKVIDFGAFKKEEDQGAQQRSSAFSLLDSITLLMVDKTKLSDHLEEIVNDIVAELDTETNEDIQITRLNILKNLARQYQVPIGNILEKFQAKLEVFLTKVQKIQGERAQKVMDKILKTLMVLQIVAQEEQKQNFLTFYQQKVLAVDALRKTIEKFNGNFN